MKNAESTGAGELVILVLSHMHHFKDVGYQKLVDFTNTYLRPYLYTMDDPESAYLLTTTFNQFTLINNETPSPKVLF